MRNDLPHSCSSLSLFKPARRQCAFFLTTLLFSALAFSQTSVPQPWQYDLKVGDRITYLETLEQEISGKELESKTRLQFNSEVLVVGREGKTSVGFQRNLEKAELLLRRERNKDVTEKEKAGFLERVAKRGVFAEANEVELDGTALHPWQAVRESVSRVLVALHEIEPLPPAPHKIGAQWTGGSTYSLTYKLTRELVVDQEPCFEIEGSTAGGKIRSREIFCPNTGLLREVELEASYATFSGDVHERFSLKLANRNRGEDPKAWLKSPTTRLGYLRALLRSNWLSCDAAQLKDAIASEPTVRKLALSIALRRGYQVPAEDQSSDDDVTRSLIASLHANSADRKIDAGDPSGTYLRFVEAGKYAGLPYVMHVPETSSTGKRLPLVIHLAGGPGLAMDGANSSAQAVRNWGWFVLYPNASGKLWWNSGVFESTEAALRDALSRFPVDEQRIFITGFSNGGTGALQYSTLSQTRFAGVVSLMGAGECVPEVRGLDYARLRSVPVLLVHGDKDPVIPHMCSEDAYRLLRKRGVQVEYKLLKNREHDITLGTDDGLSWEFMKRIAEKP